jgi:hypothetical protein
MTSSRTASKKGCEEIGARCISGFYRVFCVRGIYFVLVCPMGDYFRSPLIQGTATDIFYQRNQEGGITLSGETENHLKNGCWIGSVDGAR